MSESAAITTMTPPWWFKLLCLAPILFVLCVYLEAAIAAAMLGHWPVPNLEDPKALPTAPLHVVATILLLSLPAGVVLVAVIVWRKGQGGHDRTPYWGWVGLLPMSWVIMYLVAHADVRTWSWWMD